MPPRKSARRRKPSLKVATNTEEVGLPDSNGEQQEEIVAGRSDQLEANSQQPSGNADQSQSPKHVVHESNTDSELSEVEPHDKKKRKIKVSSNLTAEEEDSMVEWLREHPEMYDKRMNQYKNQQRKEALWQQKSDEMGKDINVLKVCYKSLRTRLCKLMKKKSGQAADLEMTDRDCWIITNLEFLRVHIERVHRRPLVSVSTNTLRYEKCLTISI